MENCIDRLLALDKALFLAINGAWASPTLDAVMVFLSLFGNGLFLAAIVAGILYFGDRPNFAVRMAAIVAAVALGIAVNSVIKQAVGRPRPLTEFSEEIRAGTVWVHWVFERWRSNSFPSGHVQAAFGTATALAYYYRRWYAVAPFFVAAGVTVSRVYLGVHFPLDTVGGALVGIGCSLAACLAWKRGFRLYARRKQRTQSHRGTAGH